MADQKDLSSPPLMKIRRSQLVSTNNHLQKLDPTKIYSVYKDKEKTHNEMAGWGKLMRSSNYIPAWWVTHKLKNSYITEVIPQDNWKT